MQSERDIKIDRQRERERERESEKERAAETLRYMCQLNWTYSTRYVSTLVESWEKLCGNSYDDGYIREFLAG